MLTASTDNTARIWDAGTGHAVGKPLRHDDRVNSAGFSPDGQRVVTTSRNAAWLWDTATCQQIGDPLRHASNVVAACFSPDGQRLLTASDDGTARLWDVPSPPLPAPAWFPDLLECVYEATLTNGSVQALPPAQDGASSWRQPRLSFTGSNVWTRVAGWFLEDRATRTISPFSSITVPVYVQRLIDLGTVQSLHEAVLLTPRNALALGRYAEARAIESEGDTNLAWAEAMFLSGRAVTLDPLNAEVWLSRAKVMDRMGRGAEAFEAIEQALTFHLDHVRTLEFKSDLLERASRWAEAAEACQRVVACLDKAGAAEPSVRRKALLRRGRVFCRANRHGEAAQALRLALDLLDRPPGLADRYVNLSSHYNASPKSDWVDPQERGGNLASLPLGVLDFGDVKFDARGIVQLSSTNLAPLQPEYPKQVASIHVGQRAVRLHFLHGTVWPLCDTNGVESAQEIARYVMHSADGQQTDVPIRYVEHVRTAQFFPERQSKEQGGAQPVWKGPQERWKQHWPKWGVRLYLTTWTNPLPDVAIESLDFVSTMTGSAPFLIAITVDPPAAMAAKPGE